MSEFQTNVQDLTAHLRGSGKLEISPYQATPSWQDAGSLSGLEVEEKNEVSKEENDNADADEVVSSQEVTVKASLHEALRASIWDVLRGSFDTKTIIPGTLVSGHSQIIASGSWAFDGFIEFDGQNASGAKQSITSVTGSVDGALVLNTDYAQVKNAAGKWGIAVRDSATVTTIVQNLTVVYDYTPPASIEYESGDKTELPWFMVRITTKNDNRPFYFIGYKAKIRTGKKFTFPKDEDKDRRVKVPVEIVCKTDPLYHSGRAYKTSQTGGM